ncbi:MAG: HlyD family efflux transporter periplasmic adaptor subunit [Pseudomonadales bacterium]|jgi:HlyD family secretion protein|nr:HlyD family efflux transporter periplasmic adaptor subunit [Pseudomonadales bacterium]
MRGFAPFLVCLLLLGCESGSDAPVVVGTLERDRVDVVADSSEPVLELRVREGDRVAAGDVLLVQDDRRAQAALARVRAEVAVARAAFEEAERGPRPEELERVRARIAAADSEVTVARLELERARGLAERSFASPSDLDLLGGRVEQAVARRRELERLLAELEAGTRSEVIARERARLDAAEQSLVDAELALERTRPVAPVDGIVEAMPVERGDRPAVGRTLVAILDDARLYARVHLPEPLRARLVVGDVAEVQLQGTDRRFRGALRWISSEAAFTPFYALTQQDATRLAYLAEIDLVEVSALPVGVPVAVRFPGLLEGAAAP